jgi:F-type H+-transporting ATPase subunit epsilon
MAKELHLRVVTPDRTVVDRKVAGVSFRGFDGGYGILPNHAPLLTGIAGAGAVKILELDGKTTSMFASDGFAQVQHNVLTLVCEAGELAPEIDLERVKAAEARAREKLAHLERGSEGFLMAEVALRKALMRDAIGRGADQDSSYR